MLLTLMVSWTLATGIPTYCAKDTFDWQAMGIYDRSAKAIYFPAETCSYLDQLRSPGDPWDAALGLIVYGHELAHARGVESHSKANCVGKKRVGILARQLGASWKRSMRLKQVAKDFSTICKEA